MTGRGRVRHDERVTASVPVRRLPANAVPVPARAGATLLGVLALATAGTGLGLHVADRGFPAAPGVTQWWLMPLVSAVWSSGRETAEQYPAAYLFQFLNHHGMLAVTGSPRWTELSKTLPSIKVP